MKLTSITVGNFKNIAETKLILNPITSVISTNNYGKSNLLEAIQFGFDFMQASARTRSFMMSWAQGIPLSPPLANEDFIFSVEFDAPELNEYRYVRYSYRFRWFKDNGDGAAITDETIEMRENEHVRYTSYLKRDKGQYRAEKSKTNFRRISLPKDVLAIDILSSLDEIGISDTITAIRSLKDKICKTLELDSSFQLTPIEFAYNSSSTTGFDDSDIPRTLAFLQKENPSGYDLFLETVYDLFPEFEKIQLQSYSLKETEKPRIQIAKISSGEDPDEAPQDVPYHIKDELYRLLITSRYLNQPISMQHMSTGTKRIIWLLVNAISGNTCGINLIGVDEIETSIHPRMMRSLLESLAEIMEDTSMIITSHSPYLIQYLKPECIYIGVPNEDGIAEFKRIQGSKTKALIKTARELGTSPGEYLFELLSGDEDSAAILSTYLED